LTPLILAIGSRDCIHYLPVTFNRRKVLSGPDAAVRVPSYPFQPLMNKN
jgi:hypothetical protein